MRRAAGLLATAAALAAAAAAVAAWRRRRAAADAAAARAPPRHPRHRQIMGLFARVPALRSPPRRPPPAEGAPWKWVDTVEGLRAAVKALAAEPRLALDLEHHGEHSYHGAVCLIQISSPACDYLVDALALRAHVGRLLGPLLAAPRCLKVLHGADSDVTWLQRDFGVFMANVFDTERAAHVLGLRERSLAALVARFAGVALDKSLQRADWRERPLSASMLQYARLDTRYLLYVADALGQELLQAGAPRRYTRWWRRGGPAVPRGGLPLPAALDAASPLATAVRRGQQVALPVQVAPTHAGAADAAALTLVRRMAAELRDRAGRLHADDVRALGTAAGRARALARWRDAAARRLDDAPRCVLPDAVLVHLAAGSAADAAAVLAELAAAPPAPPGACRFPAEARAGAAGVAAALAGAHAWAHPEVERLLAAHGGGAGSSARSPAERAARVARVGACMCAKRTPYDNCRMLGRDGALLAHTDAKRLRWYIAKGLANLVCDDPLTVRLRFLHKDEDQQRGMAAYYSAARENRCVGCGAAEHFLRYRVVPQAYRSNLPVEMKSHRSHDVLLVCLKCHLVAQQAAERLKRRIAEEYRVPLLPPAPAGAPGAAPPPLASKARGAAIVLARHREVLPPERRRELEAVVRAYAAGAEPELAAGAGDVTDAELRAGMLAGLSAASRRRELKRWLAQGVALPAALAAEAAGERVAGAPAGEAHARLPATHAWHGRLVVEAAAARGELRALCARFRAAFVEAVRPEFLPEGWAVGAAAPRTFGPGSVYA